MTLKQKSILGFVVSLLMMVVFTTQGSLGVFAESQAVQQPAKTIEVELNDDFFNPKAITLSSGSTTTLVLKNKGSKEHTFTVSALGIDAEIQPGQEKTITVPPTKPGTYGLICRYHVQNGMAGQIIVQ